MDLAESNRVIRTGILEVVGVDAFQHQFRLGGHSEGLVPFGPLVDDFVERFFDFSCHISLCFLGWLWGNNSQYNKKRGFGSKGIYGAKA